MLIPHDTLPPGTLDQLLDDYVTRDGTDNGQFTTMANRKAHLLASLERDEVFITFNYEHLQACLVSRHEVEPSALREYDALKASLKEDAEGAACEAKAALEFQRLFSDLHAEGVLPMPLGRTLMQSGVSFLIQGGKVSEEELRELLRRHSEGDYGLVCWGDKLRNLESIKCKGFLYSRYDISGISLCVETGTGHLQTIVKEPQER
ncbi:hypothetical protein GIW05_02985 [Pseudomonas syringae]|uniref:YheU family protein n=1 Tax=Pseudomonas syringae TaxID=317 RepID=UPI001F3570D8|nr:YheU family protein [Pseudomonas syringae]MCF5382470.1 hypothetical protein [Pseudomonas syringae]MCF5419357.1 hypothetical protein [Pseudomonas syringae]MCF5455037.1 hypothetical protein [Pseudomonas syringae]MCF5460479.1 hypothetical protein [Pseudomonas syringae]